MLQRSVDICRIDGNEKKKRNGGTEIGMGRERETRVLFHGETIVLEAGNG